MVTRKASCGFSGSPTLEERRARPRAARRSGQCAEFLERAVAQDRDRRRLDLEDLAMGRDDVLDMWSTSVDGAAAHRSWGLHSSALSCWTSGIAWASEPTTGCVEPLCSRPTRRARRSAAMTARCSGGQGPHCGARRRAIRPLAEQLVAYARDEEPDASSPSAIARRVLTSRFDRLDSLERTVLSARPS